MTTLKRTRIFRTDTVSNDRTEQLPNLQNELVQRFLPHLLKLLLLLIYVCIHILASPLHRSEKTLLPFLPVILTPPLTLSHPLTSISMTLKMKMMLALLQRKIVLGFAQNRQLLGPVFSRQKCPPIIPRTGDSFLNQHLQLSLLLFNKSFALLGARPPVHISEDLEEDSNIPIGKIPITCQLSKSQAFNERRKNVRR